MKKLISVEAIEALVKQGETNLCTREGVILTPSAKDAAKAANLTICPGRPDCAENPCVATPCEESSCEANPCEEASCEDQISAELIYSALKVLQMQRAFD